MPTSSKTSQGFVAGRHFPFTLEHMDGNGGLAVSRRGKNLALFGGNRGVFLDQAGHHAAKGFDTQRKRGHIQQKDIFDIALEHPPLNRCAQCHHFIRVDPLVRLSFKYLPDHFLNRRHSCHTADQDHFVDISGTQTRVFDGRPAGPLDPGQQIADQRLEFCPRDFHVHMFRSGGVGSDKRQIHIRFHGCRQFHFCLFSRFPEPLKRHLVLPKIDALIFLELVSQVIDEPQVEILSAPGGCRRWSL